ncbi:hypothetical protein Trydic_g19328 [Trypoxylus dichotomus]
MTTTPKKTGLENWHPECTKLVQVCKGDKKTESRTRKGIHGPVKNNTTHQHRMRTKRELEELYNQSDTVKIIKSERLRAGHVKGQNQRVVKWVWGENPVGKRQLERPTL